MTKKKEPPNLMFAETVKWKKLQFPLVCVNSNFKNQ